MMEKEKTNSIQTKPISSRISLALQQALRPSCLISAGILTFSLAAHPLTAQTLELSDLDGNNGFVINGADFGNELGRAVSGLGDINGDGIDDLILGAYRAGTNGVSYVVFGRSNGSPFTETLELSALDGNNGFTINGAASGDRFGEGVSGLGDVNNDGIDDLLIGAPGADPNGNDSSGASYVVFGRSGGATFAATLEASALDGSNGFVLNGVASNGVVLGDFSGRAVSGLGDINGDGIDDLLIGATGANNYGGASYVVFGQSLFAATLDLSTLDGNNGFVLNGTEMASALSEYSGRAVSGVNDINGDGVADLVIGAHRSTSNFVTRNGASYVVFGQSGGATFTAALDLSTLDGNNGFAINGVLAGDESGFAVSGLGDINGDNIADLLIGSYRADPNGSYSGASYVVFGQSLSPFAATLDLSALDGNNGFVINGVAADDRSGFSVSDLGDVNSDGAQDLLIGARGVDSNGNYSGASYVVFGQPSASPFAATLELSTLDGNNGFVINGATADDRSGFAVSGLGDVNSDGIDDLLIGARGVDSNGSFSGASYIVFGTPTDNTPDSFDLIDLTDVAPASPQTSNAIIVSGINAAASISVNNGLYAIDDREFTSSPGTVNNGSTVRVRHTSSANFSTITNTLLTIGGVSETFTTVTAAEDISVDAFTLTDLSDVALASEQTSDPITVTGINSAVAISVVNGFYSIDGAAFTASDGTVNNGQTVRVQHTSSADFLTPVDTVLTIGNQSDTFTTTTLADSARADLNLTLAAIPNPILRNDTIEYAHTLTNQGPDPTGGIQLEFNFPDALSLNGAFSADNWDCIGITDTLNCSLNATLAAAATTELRLSFTALRLGAVTTTTSVSSASADPDLSDNQVTANTTVFETEANILVNPNSSLLTTETGGTASFIVVLTRAPSDDVTLSLASNNTAEGTIDGAVNNNIELTFTPTNWNEIQTVTVTGVNDAVEDGNRPYSIITSPLVSNDPGYNNLNPTDISLINIDATQNPDIFVTSISGPTSEDGATAAFSVTLTAQPSADVTIDISSDNPNEGTVDTSLLVFTSSNWVQPRTVIVTGQDDNVIDGDVAYIIVTGTAVSADTNYHGRNPADLRVINLDNEPSLFIFEDGFEE